MYVEKTDAMKNHIAKDTLNSLASLYPRKQTVEKEVTAIAYILGSVLCVRNVGRSPDKMIMVIDILKPNSFLKGNARSQK